MKNSKPYLQKNLSLAWPMALNALLIQSMLMIDTLLVAPLGEVSVAAMGIAATIVAASLGIETAICNGVQLIVGRAYGSRNKDNLVMAFWVGLFINVSASLLLFFMIIFFGSDLVAILTNDAELIKLVESYLDITKYIILITAYTQICISFYNGCGITKLPLMAYAIEIPANAILSYLLINGYGEFNGLGVVGAAWGSLAAIFLRTVFLYVIMKTDKNLDLTYPKERLFWTEIKPQLEEILPIAANFFVLFIGASVYQLLFAQLDLSSFVAITLIFPWFRIGTQFVAAWAHASAINISQAIGEKDTEHLKIFITACRQATIALTIVIALLFLILSQNILLIYPTIEPETQTALYIIAPIYIILPIFRGYNSVSANILRALGDSQRALIVNFVAQWMIALPLCALLILYFEVSVFWAFGMMLLEELLKIFHFSKYTKLNLERIKYSVVST
ncbi:MATE family efflux transporter [Mariniflexile sp.]|uniref:MATE family efflux transporter n=1 Tax=Mariniflexile sp. TaxID=1979402 RepID=UPI0035691A49